MNLNNQNYIFNVFTVNDCIKCKIRPVYHCSDIIAVVSVSNMDAAPIFRYIKEK